MTGSEVRDKPAIVYPRGDLTGRLRRLSAALVPLSWLYAAGFTLVRGIRRRETRRATGSPWVISVGNIEVGGNGKTPLSILLLKEIQERNGRAVYISRGYRSRATRAEGVTVVVPSGTVGRPLPGVRLVRRDDPGLASEIGDEGAVVAWRLPGVPLLLGRNKQQALEIAARMFAPTHVILDDAFQSWSVPRDRDVVLVSGAAVGSRRLPAGPLRENVSALGRAHVVLCNDTGVPGQLDDDLERLETERGT